jgi:hypothetical protein
MVYAALVLCQFRQVAVDMLQTARTNIGGQSLRHVNEELNAHDAPDSLPIAVDERSRLPVSWLVWQSSAVYQPLKHVAIDSPFPMNISVWRGQWLIVCNNKPNDVRGGRHSDGEPWEPRQVRSHAGLMESCLEQQERAKKACDRVQKISCFKVRL